jgi:hypothetical protein
MMETPPPPIIGRIRPLDNGTYEAILYLENIQVWRMGGFPDMPSAQAASIAKMMELARTKPENN